MLLALSKSQTDKFFTKFQALMIAPFKLFLLAKSKKFNRNFVIEKVNFS